MFRRTIPVVLVAAMAVCGSTLAEDGKKPGKKGAGKLDQAAVFKRLDENGDGKLSRDEFAKIGQMRKKDGEGGKGQQLFDKIFDRLDEDKSGALSADEFKKMADQVKKKAGEQEKKKRDKE